MSPARVAPLKLEMTSNQWLVFSLKDIQHLHSGGQRPGEASREKAASKTHWQTQVPQATQEESYPLERSK